MKKILIVNNDLKIGGIQKSLANLLNNLSCDNYEISLLVFNHIIADGITISPNIKIIKVGKAYSILGLSKHELKKRPFLFLLKAFFIIISKIFGKRFSLKIIGLFQRKIDGYDVAVSYSHLTSSKSFDNGSAEFVLDKVNANTKYCFIHCDYKNSGYFSIKNNKTYNEFDKLVCCSNSVKHRLCECAPELEEKAVVLRNLYDLNIIKYSNLDTNEKFDELFINLVCVTRLSQEKGIDRIISCLYDSNNKQIKVYIIGSGPLEEQLCEDVDSKGLKNQIVFLGEKSNPYPYISKADYLILLSYHEAAPIVFDEAHLLGTRIISSETTSAKEMLFDDDIICSTDREVIECFSKLKKINKKSNRLLDNEAQLKSISKLFDI